MSHIVSPTDYPTKKAFREAVATSANRIWLHDPAIIDAFSGHIADVLAVKHYITVTNHPKRSWYAEVDMHNGSIRVK